MCGVGIVVSAGGGRSILNKYLGDFWEDGGVGVLLVGEPAFCVNEGLSPWIPCGKIYMGIHAPIKTARRKVAGTKQFIKAKGYSQGGRMGRFLPGLEQALGCLGIGYLLCLFGLGGAVTIQWGSL